MKNEPIIVASNFPAAAPLSEQAPPERPEGTGSAHGRGVAVELPLGTTVRVGGAPGATLHVGTLRPLRSPISPRDMATEELKSLWMRGKEECEKVGLKFNFKKTKIMAYGPITSWQIDGETMEIVTDFVLLGSKITADSNCSHEIKRWKKSYDKPRQHI